MSYLVGISNVKKKNYRVYAKPASSTRNTIETENDLLILTGRIENLGLIWISSSIEDIGTPSTGVLYELTIPDPGGDPDPEYEIDCDLLDGDNGLVVFRIAENDARLDVTITATGIDDTILRVPGEFIVLNKNLVPEISFDTLTLNLGEIVVMQTTDGLDVFTISNNGDGDLNISEITAPTNYEIKYGSLGSWGLTTGQQSISASCSEDIYVRATPISVATYTGDIVIESNDSDYPLVNVAVTVDGISAPLVIPEDYIAWWKFDNTITDETGNHDFIDWGHSFTTGKFNQAVIASIFGQIGTSSFPDCGATWAVSFWWHPGGAYTTDYGDIIKQEGNFSLRVNSDEPDAEISVYYYDNGTNQLRGAFKHESAYTFQNVIVNSTLTHLKVYLDNVEVMSYEKIGAPGVGSYIRVFSGGTYTQRDIIDQMRWYDRDLTLGEITALAEEIPIPTDYIACWLMNDNAANTTVTDEAGTYTGTATTNTSSMSTTGVGGVANTAFDFDGSNERITLNNLAITGINKISIVAWVYVSGIDATSHILYRRGGTASDYISYLIVNSKITIICGSDMADGVLQSTDLMLEDEWVLCVTTINGDTGLMQLYTNTTVEESTFNTFSNFVVSNYPKDSIGGFLNANTEMFDGKIDNLRIYPRVITADEVAAILTEKP